MKNNENIVVATQVEPCIVNVTPVEAGINNNMKIVYSYGRTIKILCFIDIIMSIFYALISPLMFIPIIFALCGLYGVKNYNISGVMFYLCYEFFIIIIRLITFFYLLDCCSDSLNFFNYFFVVLATILGLWILEILSKYIKNLKKLSIEQINILQTIHHIPTARVIYY
jgi:hypothetical protein